MISPPERTAASSSRNDPQPAPPAPERRGEPGVLTRAIAEQTLARAGAPRPSADSVEVAAAPALDPVLSATTVAEAVAAFVARWGLHVIAAEWDLATLQELHRVFALAPQAHVDVATLLGVRLLPMSNFAAQYTKVDGEDAIGLSQSLQIPAEQNLRAMLRIDDKHPIATTEFTLETHLPLQVGEILSVEGIFAGSAQRERAQIAAIAEVAPGRLRVTLARALAALPTGATMVSRGDPVTQPGLEVLILHELGHAVDNQLGVSRALATEIGWSIAATPTWVASAMSGRWGVDDVGATKSAVYAMFDGDTLANQGLAAALAQTFPDQPDVATRLGDNPVLRELARVRHASTPRGEPEHGANVDGTVFMAYSLPKSSLVRCPLQHVLQRTSDYSLSFHLELFAENYAAFYSRYGEVPDGQLGDDIPDPKVRSWFRSNVHNQPLAARPRVGR
jgi:hypothetical protein